MKATRETKTSHYCRKFLLPFVLFFVAYIGAGAAQTDSETAKGGSQTTTSERDGQHDFDFALGAWKARLKRLEHPLTGSNTWVEFDGTFVARAKSGMDAPSARRSNSIVPALTSRD